MANSSDVQRAWRTGWAGSLSMVVCLSAAGSTAAERLLANPAVSSEADVALRSAPHGISARTGDPLNEAIAEVQGPLVRYLLRELMAQRLVNAQLSADLETGGLDIELAQRGTQFADATGAAGAEIEPGKERGRLARQASGRADGQLAAKKDQRRELDRQLADARSETEDMRQGLDATYRPELHVIPLLKPRLRAGEGDAWARPSDPADDGAWPRADTVAPIEGDGSIKASSLDGAISNWPPTTDHTASRARLNEAAARLASGLRGVRDEAISQRQERVFTLDLEERGFATESTAELVPLDPALNIYLLTVKSERVGKSRAGIRFFADGSSTGGRIELKLLGDRAAINVQWATGAVTLER